MRTKNIFIFTENLNFFYRVNKELIRLNIKFDILNVRNTVPIRLSIVLTTSEEIHKLEKTYEKLIILPYSNEDNFNHYILKILAIYKIGFKSHYSELTFSIDPGTTQIGIAVFLDDFFLQSHTIYEKKKVMKIINDYIICFQNEDSNLQNLNFKIGSGVKFIVIDLIKQIYSKFKNRKSMKVYLIDESYSSKIRIQDKNKFKRSKHEISALIIALREGFEVNPNDYYQIIRTNKFQITNNNNQEDMIFFNIKEREKKVVEIIKKILKNNISLTNSSIILKEFNSNNPSI